MFDESVSRILDSLPDDAVVLDIGAWGKPFKRANWVIDRMPYETRGLYGFDGPDPERFTSATWIQRDLCDKTPYPFGDNEIDFVICSHTLEDVRDPIWLCSEIARIGKAGYLETPSRLEEQCYGFQGPWVGWGHHHWIVEMDDGSVTFAFKHHVVNRWRSYFPAEFHSTLTERERVQMLFWEGSFEFSERFFDTPPALDGYLESFVERELAGRGLTLSSFDASLPRKAMRRLRGLTERA